MSSFCGSDNDENDYEIGYRDGRDSGYEDGLEVGIQHGAAVAFGIIGMFTAIRSRYMDEFIEDLKRIRARRYSE